MDYDKLIEQLRWWAEHCDRTNYGCQVRTFLLDAATAISTLKDENEKLRADLARVTAERDAVVENVKHLKAVMRDEGIVVIPPKYPWERSEWNM